MKNMFKESLLVDVKHEDIIQILNSPIFDK